MAVSNNQTNHDLTYRWIRLGAICGPLAILTYAVLILVPLPNFWGMLLVSAFGPLLGLASVGLYHFMALARKTMTLQIAVAANIIAIAIVTTMLIVQMSLNIRMERAIAKVSDPSVIESLKAIWRGVDSVQLGMDVAWDVFGVLGALLFAINMLWHPRLGKIIGMLGIVLALGLFVFNIYTFPTPPAEANLLDLGPLVALWYVVVSIMILFSLGWARKRLAETD
jgi:hypothetical protein